MTQTRKEQWCYTEKAECDNDNYGADGGRCSRERCRLCTVVLTTWAWPC